MIPSSDNQKIALCRLSEVPLDGAAGFRIETRGGPREVFVINRAGKYHVYLNSCPHTGVTLDWQPNHFLDNSGTLIQCSTHGALFRIEDGLCIYGPCLNRSLTSLPAVIDADQLYLLARTGDSPVRPDAEPV